MSQIYLQPFSDEIQIATEFFTLTNNNREYLRQWLPWLDFVQTVADTHKFLQDNTQSDKIGTTCNFFICKDNQINDDQTKDYQIIGTIGLREINKDSAVVGYWLDQTHSGQGITTNALQQLIQIVQKRQLSKTLILRCNPNNIASQKIAKKCGFHYQQTLANAENLYGVWHDLEVYKLVVG